MQTIILSEQESEQSHSTMSVRSPVGTLIFGLFLGLLLLLFDRRNQPQVLEPQPERTGGWGRTLWVLLIIGVALFVLINLIMGP